MLLLALGWTLYFTLHSLLATTWAKAAAARRWPVLARFYRLAYNVIALVGFGLLYRWQNQLPDSWLFRPASFVAAVAYALLAAGLLLVVLALQGYGIGEFAGWTYLRGGAAAGPLRTRGLNRVVRHPLHLGFLLLALGYWLLAPTVVRSVFVSCNIAYLFIGNQLEERRLAEQFGAAYARYQARVPQLLPLPWRRPAEDSPS